MESRTKGASGDRRQLAKKRRKAKFKPIKLKVSRLHKPDDIELEEWQRLLRKQFAEQQAYKLKNTGSHPNLFRIFAHQSPVG